jgi:hypothetical protein
MHAYIPGSHSRQYLADVALEFFGSPRDAAASVCASLSVYGCGCGCGCVRASLCGGVVPLSVCGCGCGCVDQYYKWKLYAHAHIYVCVCVCVCVYRVVCVRASMSPHCSSDNLTKLN